jgi:radical SAM protein with 4Fe4S-binding SPASM domain
MHPQLVNSSLKNQEELYLYNFKKDERYEVDPESFEFLRHCTGRNSLERILKITGSDEVEAGELLDYLLSEDCIRDKEDQRASENFPVEEGVLPSLRYLQLHITERCNLDCCHCYLGEKEKSDLEISIIKKALTEFSPNGLKVLITGGEPLMHKDFWEVARLASTFPVRLEILTNGTMITEEVAKKLAKYIHGVQISLDGLKVGHEHLRGGGCFEKAVRGIKNASQHLDVSIATMVHKGNLTEFRDMKELVQVLGAKEWNLDIPSLKGNAKPDIIPTDLEAAEIFRRYGFGSGVHEGDQGYSCGSHICTIDTDGGVSKCGFFEDGVGNIKDESLNALWRKVVEKYTPSVEDLKCGSCKVIENCRGGCRYRALTAGDLFGKDSFMCTVHLGGNE